MNLDEWLERIDQLHSKSWDPGLERVGEVASRLGVTHPAHRVVLVAGTNGKGSTCEVIELIARQAGLSVGKSTSPHLIRFNERIVVDGEPAADEEIVAAFETIDEARGDISLSYFEFGALAAMLVFMRRGVDVAVLEIGLGGRLDAMNVVAPDVSVITQIALDHQDWLGHDRETIGREKAGIMRPGVPCIVGDPSPPESIMNHAKALGTECLMVGRDDSGAEELPALPIPQENIRCAIEACRALGISLAPAELEQALARFSLPGRLQWHTTAEDQRVLLDVAHNPNAAERLAKYLSTLNLSGCVAVFGSYADKDIVGVCRAVAPLVDRWFVAGMDVARGADPDRIAAAIAETDGVVSGKYDKVADAFDAACATAGADDVILVFGSFIIVGGVLEHLVEQLP